MGDYGGTALWNWSGCLMEYNDLPVTCALIEKIRDWSNRYFTSIDSWHEGDADSFERIVEDDQQLKAHALEGLELAREIKAQLPGWTVVYHDGDKANRYDDRSIYRFEVT